MRWLNPQPPVLAVEHLSKSFGTLRAVDGSAFTVAPGEIVGLVGPNGAGKSTTINMILGVLEPSEGRIAIEGVDLRPIRSRALAGTNFAAVYAPLPGNLTIEQNLRVFGMIYGVEGLSERIDELLATYDLSKYRTVKAGSVFRGADAVEPGQGAVNRPRLLLLDEPTARSILSARGTFARAFLLSSTVGTAASCGPATTCTRSRWCATACSSSRAARWCCRETRRPCPASTGRQASMTCSSPWRRKSYTRGGPVSARRVAAILLRQFYLLRGSPQRIVPLFAWAAIDIVLWGFITRYLNSVGQPGLQLRALAAGGGIALGLPDQGHARRDDGVLRGRLVAQFLELLRHAASHLRIPGGHRRHRGLPRASSGWSPCLRWHGSPSGCRF